MRQTELLRDTTNSWQNAYAKPLTTADAQEVFDSIAGYFDLLDKWDRETDVRISTPDEAAPIAPLAGGAASPGIVAVPGLVITHISPRRTAQ